jgi:hypothetical protein
VLIFRIFQIISIFEAIDWLDQTGMELQRVMSNQKEHFFLPKLDLLPNTNALLM